MYHSVTQQVAISAAQHAVAAAEAARSAYYISESTKHNAIAYYASVAASAASAAAQYAEAAQYYARNNNANGAAYNDAGAAYQAKVAIKAANHIDAIVRQWYFEHIHQVHQQTYVEPPRQAPRGQRKIPCWNNKNCGGIVTSGFTGPQRDAWCDTCFRRCRALKNKLGVKKCQDCGVSLCDQCVVLEGNNLKTEGKLCKSGKDICLNKFWNHPNCTRTAPTNVAPNQDIFLAASADPVADYLSELEDTPGHESQSLTSSFDDLKMELETVEKVVERRQRTSSAPPHSRYGNLTMIV